MGGLISFICLPLLALVIDEVRQAFLLHTLVLYGAVICTFVGALQWEMPFAEVLAKHGSYAAGISRQHLLDCRPPSFASCITGTRLSSIRLLRRR
jgi:hypothetical protein